MISNRICSVETYKFSGEDRIFIDTNVWFHIHGPQVRPDSNNGVYSKAFKDILSAKSRIFIDVLVLSEFINRYARLQHRISNDTTDYKRWRKSEDFEPIAKSIADVTRRIIRCCKRIDSCFGSVDVDVLLNDFEKMCPDFNDQILIEICKTNNLKFLTHDSDFKNKDISILTANPRLLT
ncbi:PIN domain-containing protein [candidate division FCPU426 bacterium]|nr:PIN domain-containing protein [candidate division FCPU426 bacterium]